MKFICKRNIIIALIFVGILVVIIFAYSSSDGSKISWGSINPMVLFGQKEFSLDIGEDIKSTIDYTKYSKTTIDSKTGQKTTAIYGRQHFVDDHGVWKKVEDMPSLLGTDYSYEVYKDDKDFKVTILDFNWTSVTARVETIEKNYDKPIPISIIEKNETACGISELTQCAIPCTEEEMYDNPIIKETESVTLSALSSTDSITLPISLGQALKFGEASTIVELTAGDIIKDGQVTVGSSITCSGTWLGMGDCGGSSHPPTYVSYIMFNTSSIPDDATIDSAKVGLYWDGDAYFGLDTSFGQNVYMAHMSSSEATLLACSDGTTIGNDIMNGGYLSTATLVNADNTWFNWTFTDAGLSNITTGLSSDYIAMGFWNPVSTALVCGGFGAVEGSFDSIMTITYTGIPETSAPYLKFIEPTLANGTTVWNSSVEINVSIEESDLGSMIYSWNYTNFTLYDDDLLLMMNFDDYTRLNDSSSYGNNGTCSNCPTYTTSGKYGSAYSFDAVNDLVDVTFLNSLGVSQCWWSKNATGDTNWIHNCNVSGTTYKNGAVGSLSTNVLDIVERYISPTTEAHGKTFAKTVTPRTYYGGFRITVGATSGLLTNVTKGSSCTATTAYLKNSSGTVLSSNAFSGNIATFNDVLIANTDYRIEASSGGGNYQVHYLNAVPSGLPVVGTYIDWASVSIDGADQTNNPINIVSLAFSPSQDSLLIGMYFNGTIDEVRIYNRSLTASEIYQLYALNLKKVDADSWEFYINQSLNSTDGLLIGNYTYETFATDGTGNLNSTGMRDIEVVTEVLQCNPTLDNDWEISDQQICDGKEVTTGTGKINIISGGTLYLINGANVSTTSLNILSSGDKLFVNYLSRVRIT